MKDDSGNYAVFTEQSASASHTTVAKVLDVIARFPGCSGQARDAVSAYTQVEMKDAPEFLHLSAQECPTFLIRLPKARRPQHWDSIETLIGQKISRKYGKEVPGSECHFLLRIMQLFLSVYVDDMSTTGKTHNMPNMWSKLQMKVDLDDPVSFFDQVYLGCTQREVR